MDIHLRQFSRHGFSQRILHDPLCISNTLVALSPCPATALSCWIPHDRACNCNALLLPAAHEEHTLAGKHVIPEWHIVDEPVCICLDTHLPDQQKPPRSAQTAPRALRAAGTAPKCDFWGCQDDQNQGERVATQAKPNCARG